MNTEALSRSAKNGYRPTSLLSMSASGRPVRQASPTSFVLPIQRTTLISPWRLRTEALEAATASLSVEAQKRAAKDAQKKAAKAEAAEAKQVEKLAKSVVTIKRIERNKKKYVTAVIGLEAFGLELKKVRNC